MNNSILNIPLERMMTVTEARRNFAKIIRETVDKGDFVLTKGGKPVVKLVSFKKKKTKTKRKKLAAWDKLKDFYGVWADDPYWDKDWNKIIRKWRKEGTRKKRIRL